MAGIQEMGIQLAVGLLFIGVLVGAAVLTISSFNTSYQATLNSNASLWTYGQNNAVSALGNSSSGILNMSAQLPTVGTMAGIGLLIAVLFVAIGGFLYTQGKK